MGAPGDHTLLRKPGTNACQIPLCDEVCQPQGVKHRDHSDLSLGHGEPLDKQMLPYKIRLNGGTGQGRRVA